MVEDVAAPVKGLINAFYKGTLSAQRICKVADTGSSTLKLDTLEPAKALERSLEGCQTRLKDAYAQSTKIFGRRFTEAVSNDQTCTSRIQGLTISLQDDLLNLNDYMLDPNAFDYGSFRYLQRDAERCCDQALNAMAAVHKDMMKAGLQLQNNLPTDDRSQLSSVRGLGIVSASSAPPPILRLPQPRTNSSGSPGPTGTPGTPGTPNSPGSPGSPGPPPFPKSDAWSQRKPVPSQVGASSGNTKAQINTIPEEHPNVPTGTSYGSFTPATPYPNTPEPTKSENSTSAKIDMQEVPTTKEHEDAVDDFIERDVVASQMTANLEFLEKRRQSRMSFMSDFQRSRPDSIVSPLTSAYPNSSTTSPFLPGGSFVMSPIVSSLPNGNFLAPKPLGGDSGSPSPIRRKQSRGSSIVLDRPESSASQDRRDSIGSYGRPNAATPQRKDSEPLMFGPPESPPVSEGRQSGLEEWGGLEHNVRSSTFGIGVPEGLEVVGKFAGDDPEKMLVGEDKGQPTPALSIQSAECLMRHDSSFYKYGGFCDSAKMILRSEQGALKVVKRPAGVYNSSMIISQKCINCSFEVPFAAWEKDSALDRRGIFDASSDLQFRQRFLVKSHLPMSTIDPIYACIFCVEDNSTIEDHDATVFFSHLQLFRHIQKHPRPLRAVEGMKVIYGNQPDVVDFDLRFKTMNFRPNPFADIRAKLSQRPSGYALVNHRPRAKGFRERDPENNKTLEFAMGAKIVGITYPERFGGAWCSGYHDGEKALFLSSTIQLEPPSQEDVTMNPKSYLTATAKWDHRYRDSNTDGWLSFSKKDKILHVGFPFQDHWCWTGQNSKGKWGIFPASFVEGLTEVRRAAPGGLAPVGSSSVGLSPGGLFPGKRERAGTSPLTYGGITPIQSAGSASLSSISPSGTNHHHHHWGSLGKLSFKRSGTMDSSSNGSDGSRSPAN